MANRRPLAREPAFNGGTDLSYCSDRSRRRMHLRYAFNGRPLKRSVILGRDSGIACFSAISRASKPNDGHSIASDPATNTKRWGPRGRGERIR